MIALALANFGAKSAAKTADLEQHGVLALAQITGLGETGTRINEQPLVKVNLHISGPGFVPFDSQDRVIASVTRLGNLTARKLVVLVNPTTQQYQIDWERSALVNGLVPAQFTLAEDNQTYDLSGQAGPLMEILQILKANNVPLNADGRHSIESGAASADPSRGAPGGRAAGATGAAAAHRSSRTRSAVAQRLPELESLRTSGALTDQEYNSQTRPDHRRNLTPSRRKSPLFRYEMGAFASARPRG